MGNSDGYTLTGSRHASMFSRRFRALSHKLDDATTRFALKLHASMLKHLQNQDLEWQELAESTLDEKLREGFSEQIRIRTAVSFQTLGLIEIAEGLYFIGWPRSNTPGSRIRGEEPPDRDEVVNINAVHEYGTDDGTIVARPLVGPSVNELRDEFRKAITTAFRSALGV